MLRSKRVHRLMIRKRTMEGKRGRGLGRGGGKKERWRAPPRRQECCLQAAPSGKKKCSGQEFKPRKRQAAEKPEQVSGQETARRRRREARVRGRARKGDGAQIVEDGVALRTGQRALCVRCVAGPVKQHLLGRVPWPQTTHHAVCITRQM